LNNEISTSAEETRNGFAELTECIWVVVNTNATALTWSAEVLPALHD
jgi:hypothetical protein